MASCDMCGRDDASFRALVEGVELTVCERCSKFGKVLAAPKMVQPRHHAYTQKKEEPELLEFVVEDASSKIKAKRELLKLTQQEFAKLVNEKESIIHHIESNASHIPLEMAKKLERVLHIQLVEKAKEAIIQKSKQKAEAYTLGDFINIRK